MRTCVTLDRAPTAEGELLLRRLGDDEFVIAIGNRVIMSSRATHSERELATLTLERARSQKAPRVVIAGLGMGFTVRAALDMLPSDAQITVVELTPAVIDWCRGPLAQVAGDVLADPRVKAVAGDVFEHLKSAPKSADAVALDL